MIRRILDYFGWAKYPEHPLIDKRIDRGVNGHIVDTVEEFSRMREMGFNVVRLDPVGNVQAMMDKAREAGIKTILSSSRNLDLAVVFRDWKPDFICVANEPDQQKFWPVPISELLERLKAVRRWRDELYPECKIIFPCASGLSRNLDAGRMGTEALIEFLGKNQHYSEYMDYLGQHVYGKTPDRILRKLEKLGKLYRANGWNKKFFITEFGFRDDVGEDKQATYLVNTLSMFSKHPEVAGACVYVWKDDPPENFGIIKASGLAKKAAVRILSSTVTR